jgi:hypothetical protein
VERIGYLKEVDVERIGRLEPVNGDEESGNKAENKACERRQKH